MAVEERPSTLQYTARRAFSLSCLSLMNVQFFYKQFRELGAAAQHLPTCTWKDALFNHGSKSDPPVPSEQVKPGREQEPERKPAPESDAQPTLSAQCACSFSTDTMSRLTDDASPEVSDISPIPFTVLHWVHCYSYVSRADDNDND
jgi:hypothetical protein